MPKRYQITYFIELNLITAYVNVKKQSKNELIKTLTIAINHQDDLQSQLALQQKAFNQTYKKIAIRFVLSQVYFDNLTANLPNIKLNEKALKQTIMSIMMKHKGETSDFYHHKIINNQIEITTLKNQLKSAILNAVNVKQIAFIGYLFDEQSSDFNNIANQTSINGFNFWHAYLKQKRQPYLFCAVYFALITMLIACLYLHYVHLKQNLNEQNVKLNELTEQFNALSQRLSQINALKKQMNDANLDVTHHTNLPLVIASINLMASKKNADFWFDSLTYNKNAFVITGECTAQQACLAFYQAIKAQTAFAKVHLKSLDKKHDFYAFTLVIKQLNDD